MLDFRIPMLRQSNYFDSLEAAITIACECKATHRATVFVHERTEYGLTIWKGNVEVFDLKDHPRARTCFAWRDSDGERTRIFTILENTFVNSAQKAVQAAICSDQQPIKLIPPLTNGLELLRQQVLRAKKIIRYTEIQSEDLVASIETSQQNQRHIQQRAGKGARRSLFIPAA